MRQDMMIFTFLIPEGLRLYFEETSTASDLTLVQNFTPYSWVICINVIPPSLLKLLCKVFITEARCAEVEALVNLWPVVKFAESDI